MKSNSLIRSSASISWITFYIVVISFAVLSTPALGSDDSMEVTPPPGSYRLLTGDGKVKIPFEVSRGDIRFHCDVNGHPTHMLLDDVFMWDELLFWGHPEVDSIGLVYDGDVSIGNDDRHARVEDGIRNHGHIPRCRVHRPDSDRNARQFRKQQHVVGEYRPA